MTRFLPERNYTALEKENGVVNKPRGMRLAGTVGAIRILTVRWLAMRVLRQGSAERQNFNNTFRPAPFA